MVMKLNKMVFDDKKIEAAANKHIETEYARYNSGEVEEEMICLRGKDSFKEGAKWCVGLDRHNLASINFVHQLQHLLFGLGINSEIEV